MRYTLKRDTGTADKLINHHAFFLSHFVSVSVNRDLSDKDRQMTARIEEARYDVACVWEDRLMYATFAKNAHEFVDYN